MDFAREALFNVLTNQVDPSLLTVLDLFGGTGAVSLEFLSRGCADVCTVDKYGPAIQFLKKIRDELDLQAEWEIIRDDAIRFIKATDRQFSLIFADPPYDFPHYDELVRLVFERNLLQEGAWFIVEHDSKTDLSGHPRFHSIRKYGTCQFSFMQ